MEVGKMERVSPGNEKVLYDSNASDRSLEPACKKRKLPSPSNRKCESCGTDDTSTWRWGGEAKRQLFCNACFLRVFRAKARQERRQRLAGLGLLGNEGPEKLPKTRSKLAATRTSIPQLSTDEAMEASGVSISRHSLSSVEQSFAEEEGSVFLAHNSVHPPHDAEKTTAESYPIRRSSIADSSPIFTQLRGQLPATLPVSSETPDSREIQNRQVEGRILPATEGLQWPSWSTDIHQRSESSHFQDSFHFYRLELAYSYKLFDEEPYRLFTTPSPLSFCLP